MRVFHYLFCLVGLHRRSHSRTHQHGLTIRSVCRGCNRPMIKDGRRWLTAARPRSQAG